MNYKDHYDRLISKAQNRTLSSDVYTEEHHIRPTCMGGTNDPINLVNLKPEEHFVAHQLLVKIYPKHLGLVLAATMMTVSNSEQVRNNKRYGWLRRRMSVAMSELQSGTKNSQYGTVWMYNLELKSSTKVHSFAVDEMLASGWVKGRKLNFTEKFSICYVCHCKFPGVRLTCSKKCNNKAISNRRRATNPLVGREKEFIESYNRLGTMNAALKEMGFPGATSCYYDGAKRILETIRIGDWCNGSMTGSDPVADGSIP